MKILKDLVAQPKFCVDGPWKGERLDMVTRSTLTINIKGEIGYYEAPTKDFHSGQFPASYVFWKPVGKS